MKTRKTIQQEFIKKILIKAEKPLSVEEILSRMSKKVHKTTVYRVLDRLKEEEIAHSIIGEGGKSYYASSNNHDDNSYFHKHLHFQCRRCHKLECVSETIALPILPNYQIQEAQLLLVGLCADCS